MASTRVRSWRRRPTPTGITTCLAPATAMHFSLAGHVHACCQNGEYAYGDVNETPLLEIWHGRRRRAMAEDLAGGDYPVGCDLCKVEHALGNRASTPAQAFDQFAGRPTEWPRQLEFTMSNRCNLACVQCNGDNSSTIRAQREGRPPLPMPYTDDFFAQLPPFLEAADIVSFLGGEPFLAPEVKRVWDLLLSCRNIPEVRVTTNATVWSDAIERYVNGLRMHLAVSIDGATKETYEAIRVGADYDRMVGIRDRMLAATRSYDSVFHLNYCLLRANWHEVGAFLLQADALDVDANIIPVFGPSDHSVFTLPEPELATVVAAVRAEDRTLRRRLRRNRGRWEAVVQMLRDQLERTETEASRETMLAAIRTQREQVATRLETERLEREARRAQEAAEREARRAREAAERYEVTQQAIEALLDAERVRRSTALVGEAEAALRAWAGQDCIEVTVEDDVVRAATEPSWASRFDVADWIGANVTTIGELVAASLGNQVEYTGPEDLSAGDRLVMVTDSVLRASEGPLRFRSIYAPKLGVMIIGTPDLIET